MSIWMLLAVGVAMNGEPLAMAKFYPNKSLCEEMRAALDEQVHDQKIARAHTSKCQELQVPDQS